MQHDAMDLLTNSRKPTNQKIWSLAMSGMASQASGGERPVGKASPSRVMGQGQVMPLAWTMYPTKANMAMRPCLTSASRRKPMVASFPEPQKSASARPRGS